MRKAKRIWLFEAFSQFNPQSYYNVNIQIQLKLESTRLVY